jgi:hypothetical protein
MIQLKTFFKTRAFLISDITGAHSLSPSSFLYHSQHAADRKNEK